MQRNPADFSAPEVRKPERRDPFADDSMEGLRANDINKVAKKEPPKANVLETIKEKLAKVDISSMVDDLKKKLFPGDDAPPVQSAQPARPSAPNTSAPVRVV